MRVLGALLAIPLFIFFWIGSITFIHPGERFFAYAMPAFSSILFLSCFAAGSSKAAKEANELLTVAAFLLYVVGMAYVSRRDVSTTASNDQAVQR